MTTGPDGIRGSGSNHLGALEALALNGVSRSPVQPVGIKFFFTLAKCYTTSSNDFNLITLARYV
jgi:hypothetical protein